MAGGAESSYKKRDNDRHIEHLMEGNIAPYCGVADSKVEILYNTIGYDEEIGGPEYYKKLFEQANSVVDKLY